MKSTMKFALSLLMGSCVLTLAACDNQQTKSPEVKTPEKMTALSENKTEAVSVTSETVKEEIPSPAAKGEAVKKTDEVEVVGKTVEEMGTTVNSDVKKDDMAEKKVVRHSEKVRKTATNCYLKEQKALLKVLESQYQQIRCTAEAAKLGENSFCRQEERRLLSEIKRVKGEIRVNQ